MPKVKKPLTEKKSAPPKSKGRNTGSKPKKSARAKVKKTPAEAKAPVKGKDSTGSNAKRPTTKTRKPLTEKQSKALAKGRGSGAGGRPKKPLEEKKITKSITLNREIIRALRKEFKEHKESNPKSSFSKYIENILTKHVKCV